MNSPRSPLSMAGLDLGDDVPLENETFEAGDFFWGDGDDASGRQDRPRTPSPPSSDGPSTVAVPLRSWIRTETAAGLQGVEQNRRSIIRKTMVAYGIAELLRHCNDVDRGSSRVDAAAAYGASASSDHPLEERCHLDNFAVRLSNSPDATIEGVDMLVPPLSAKIGTPFFLSNEFHGGGEEGDEEELGQFLEVEIRGAHAAAEASNGSSDQMTRVEGSGDDSSVCHLLGVLMYELYSETTPYLDEPASLAALGMDDGEHLAALEPSPKRKSSFALHNEDDEFKTDGSSRGAGDARCEITLNDLIFQYVPLKDLGFPASISLLVKSLLECGWEEFCHDDALTSLTEASGDLHLLLQDPCRFLFDKVLGGDSGGAALIDIMKNKIYGRDAERTLITDVFCRVSMAGESEALFVEGFSGSGKSRLVQSVIPYVEVSGGYVIQKKFDPISQERPMSVVLSAFNELCVLVSEKRSKEELNSIVFSLRTVFGSHLSTLTRVLPNVALLSPDLNAAVSRQGDINISRVYFIVQLFLRVVTSNTHPLVLFLDDVHWCDGPSLDVLLRILSDIKSSSSVYFVGSYRSNEVSDNHPLFAFINELEASGVQTSNVHLDGMEITEVNQMVSDALGILPRISLPLSRLMVRKTEGNPLFVLECLRSLADRGLLQYSMRERRWLWDTDKIASDEIASNVCDLLSTKMTSLSDDSQLALKVASSFGNALNSTVVETLMLSSPKYVSLQKELDKAVEDGFMNKSSSGSAYKFSHDKMREAAYSLVRNNNQFHHEMGLLLYYAMEDDQEKLDSIIYLIVDQINHGDICDPSLRIKVAALNQKAASKAIRSSNYSAAYFYSKVAMKLLPDDHWQNQYHLSLAVFLGLSNAAYSEGHIEEAASAIDEILEHGRTLNEKLDAYNLKIRLLFEQKEGKVAYETCVEVLTQLGETIPPTTSPESFVETSDAIQGKLSKMTEADLEGMDEMTDPLHYSLMRFHEIAGFISFSVKPPMLKWHSRREVELSLEHGACKYSELGIMRFAMVLGGKLFGKPEEAYRIGKIAMRLIERRFDDTDLLPSAYMLYYGYIAVQEPFQSSADMLKRGSEIGHSIGDLTVAGFLGIHYVQKFLFSGMNLVALKKECDYLVRLVEANSSRPMILRYARAFQETVALLIDKDLKSSSEAEDDEASRIRAISESLTYHQVVRNFWMGHHNRVLYFADKPSAVSDDDVSQMKSTFIIFYAGISCSFATRTYNNLKSNKKLARMVTKALDLMKEKAEQSKWNYSNKQHLLEAQYQSAMGKKDEARASFNAAVSAARESKLVHEEGLACELGALHCLKYNDTSQAKVLFKEAKKCYEKWGSQVRVESIERQLTRLE